MGNGNARPRNALGGSDLRAAVDAFVRDITSEDRFPAFLRHLAEDEGRDALAIIAVVEKPWRWQAEFDAWAEEG